MSKSICSASITLCAISLFASSAGAHPLTYHTDAFAAGVGHPLSGIDHILAMIAVGIVAAQRGGRAVWQLPLLFIGAMIVGGAVGIGRQEVPLVEQGIAASVLVLGLLIASGARLRMRVIVGLIALFALFHGYAHGVELGAGLGPMGFAGGFILSTAFLHALGISVGIVIRRAEVPQWSQIVGTAIAVIGLTLFVL